MKKLYILLSLAVISLTTQAQVNLDFGLISAFTFNGNAADTTGTLLAGTVNQATLTTDRFTSSNSAYDFPGMGMGSNIIVPYNSAMTLSEQVSISAWINLPDVALNQKIVGRCDYSFNSGFILGVENDSSYVEVWDAGGTHWSFKTPGLLSGTWTHVGFTWKSGGYLVAYLNGVAIDSVTASLLTIGNNTDPLVIGAAPWDQVYFQTTGKIDDIFMYSRAINAAEMWELYNYAPLGVGNLNSENKLLCYPNPAVNGKVFLNIPANEDVFAITVFNNQGKVVKAFRDPRNSGVLDLSALHCGMYTIRAIESGKVYCVKVVVE